MFHGSIFSHFVRKIMKSRNSEIKKGREEVETHNERVPPVSATVRSEDAFSFFSVRSLMTIDTCRDINQSTVHCSWFLGELSQRI